MDVHPEWNEAELGLLRRCFAAGTPDLKDMSDPGFVFSPGVHQATHDRLALSRPLR